MTKKFLKFILFLSTWLLMAAAWPGHAYEVSLTPDSRLTIRAQDTYLQKILQDIAEQGVRVRIDPKINFRVTAAYDRKPIREVMDAILGDTNHALIWSDCPDCPDDSPDGGYRLIEIQIYESGHRDRMAPLKDPNFNVARDPETGALFVRHELLVKLQNEQQLPELKGILCEAGGRIVGKTESRIYRIKLPKDVDELALLVKLKEKTGISGAEPNYAYQAPAPIRAAHPKIDLPEISNKRPAGNQVPVAVFDSGLSPEFQNQAYIVDAFNAMDPEAPIDDHLGHGTQMSMLAAGAIDPIGGTDDSGTVPVIAIRGFDANGITSNYTLMEGLSHAMEKGARVLSLSWHSETRSEFLKGILAEATAKGLTIVAAAGNEPTGKAVYPAAYENVIGVGALHPSGQKWENSNFGDFVSYQAPGFANMPVGYNSEPGIYAGTSISTAYTANRIAGYLSDHPSAGQKEIREFLSRH
ncbi:MAG: S8 family serine peptidase [Desulfobacterales bacterium]|nr:S8 family serine peptidase [Desulfobacterales bacterium]